MKKFLILALLVLVSGFYLNDAFAIKSISDDQTGGDCAIFGTWDSSTKTCKFSSDLQEPIDSLSGTGSAGLWIASDGITIDGNGFTLTGIPNSNGGSGGAGIMIYGQSDITVKNLKIDGDFSDCIAVGSSWYTDRTKLTENTLIENNSFECDNRSIYLDDNPINTIIRQNTYHDFDEPSENCYDSNNNGFCDASFEYDNSPKCTICEPIEPSIVLFSTDKSTYQVDETIIISGHIDNHFSDYDAVYHINAPNGPSILQNSATIDSNGDFTAQILVDDSIFALEGTYEIIVIHVAGSITATTTFDLNLEPIDGPFTLPCSMQEAGDGVSTSSCHGFYSNSIARAEVGINYHTGLFPIENYEAVGFFLDENGGQMEPISVTLDIINPGESKTLIFENTIAGFVSEFQMQMIGGDLQTGVTDTIPPVVVVPNNMAIEATSNNPSPVTFSVSASDDVDGPLTPACTHASGSNFPIGTTAVTCTATDAAGNQSSESFTITVTFEQVSDSNVLSLNLGQDSYNINESFTFFGTQTGNDVVYVIIRDSDGTFLGMLSDPEPTPGEFSVIPRPVENFVDSSGYYTATAFTDSETEEEGIVLKLNFDGVELDTDLSSNDEPESDVDFESHVTIVPTSGSGAPGCEETSTGCFIPETAYVAIDGLVIFSNTDSAAHTFTAGGENGNTGEFDTGLLMAGGTFEYIAEEAGEIEYYCMVHPWMVGVLVVGGDSVDTPDSTLPMDISARTNTSSYDDGDNVVITGQILDDLKSGYPVHLNVVSPGNEIVSIAQISSLNSDGSFSYNFNVGGPLYKTTGTYTILIAYGPLQESISFRYVGEYSEPPSDKELEIESLSTRKTQYRTGDTIVISGKVKTTDFNIPVTLQVINGGSLVDISQIQISSDQTFTHTILAEGPLWSESGKYSIKATFGNDVEDTSFIFRTDDRTYPEPEPVDDEVTIVPTNGSGAPGCEETSDGCYIPRIVSVSKYGTVIMKNTDTAAHTFTSGTPDEGPTGEFDTSLLMAGGSFEWSPESEGIYPYFCMVHPWMIGTILVGEGTLPPPSPEPEPEDHVDLEIEMDSRVYDINTVASLNIFVSGTNESQNVAIDVTDPRGTTIISRSMTVDPDTGIGFEFNIDENFKQGNYKVTATTSDGKRTEKDTTHFKVKSQFNSFKIDSVSVTDQKGNPSDLEAGDTGFIKVNLSSSKSIATLLTVNIFDAELTSIGIGSVQTTLSSGGSEIILSFNIPDDAAIGPAEIYVNAFSDWPSEGGVPLTGEVSIVEDIE